MRTKKIKKIRQKDAKNTINKIIKKAKGITLISLVITIIILLILAGVTLSLTLGDNGIITQAQKAKEAQEIAAIKEDFQLAILDKELEKGGAGLTQEELEEIAGNYGELQEDGNTIKTDDGYEIKIDEIYKPGGGTSNPGSGASDEELAALEEKIEELEQTVKDLTNTKTELEGTIEDLNGQLEQAEGDKTALQEQIENLQGQVDSLNKTIEQQESTINDLNTQIADLKAKQATGNATVADVLKGKTFSNGTQVGLTGTMENRGAINQTLNAGGSYTIPAGYHNGSGKVTANSLASQTSATAAAGNILSGKTAWVNGNKITGSMANKGNLNWSGSNTTYSVPAGYYSGGTLDSRPSYNAGYSAGNSAGYNNGYNAGVQAGKTSFTISLVSGWPNSQTQTFAASVGSYYIAAMGGDPGYFNNFSLSGGTIMSHVTAGDTPPNGSTFARMVVFKATSSQVTVDWGDTLGYGGGGIVCKVN